MGPFDEFKARVHRVAEALHLGNDDTPRVTGATLPDGRYVVLIESLLATNHPIANGAIAQDETSAVNAAWFKLACVLFGDVKAREAELADLSDRVFRKRIALNIARAAAAACGSPQDEEMEKTR